MSSRLPDALFKALEARLHQVPLRTLQVGYRDLSRDYRSRTVSEEEQVDNEAPRLTGRTPGGYAPAEARALGYLAARFPATYAAAQAALRQIPDSALAGLSSVLDLGAGPGTATWALCERVPQLSQASFIESDAQMLAQAQAIGANFPGLKLSLKSGDLTAQLAQAPAHDIVVMAYVLSELDEAQQQALLQAAWAKAGQGLFLIEPGTPETSRRLLAARQTLVELGAKILGPCPQDGPCPAEGKEWWCHFSVRLERRGLHKRVKGGDLGYEDEKYTWLYVSKSPAAAPLAPYRLHSRPHRLKRTITLDVCDAQGQRRKLKYDRRKDPASLRQAARQLEWGDAWDPAAVPDEPAEEGFEDEK